jgi:hypothetical protein
VTFEFTSGSHAVGYLKNGHLTKNKNPDVGIYFVTAAIKRIALH